MHFKGYRPQLMLRWVLLAAVSALAGSGLASAQEMTSPELLVVTSGADDGEGSLRAAINRNNEAPGTYRIVLAPPEGGTLLIRPVTALPDVVGPVQIIGPWRYSNSSPRVILDGSRMFDFSDIEEPGNPKICPGENPGSFGPNTRSIQGGALTITDTEGVEISGFGIRLFCSGIVSVRSQDTWVHDMRFDDNLGGAGVMFTGDDGTAEGGAAAGTSTGNILERNYFLNNSDSVDLARGDDGAVLQDNTMIIDGTGLGVPSSGIEACCGSKNATIERNYLSGFADALQIGGDGGFHIAYNEVYANTVGISVTSSDNEFVGNTVHGNRTGIGIKNVAGNRLTGNPIYENGKAFSYCSPGGSSAGVCLDRNWDTTAVSVSLGHPTGALEIDEFAGCAEGDTDCVEVQSRPIIDAAAWDLHGIMARGSLTSRPDSKYDIEFFVSRSAGPGDMGEAEEFLGTVEAKTNAEGRADFALPPTMPLHGRQFLGGAEDLYVTAIATHLAEGNSSEISAPVAVSIP